MSPRREEAATPSSTFYNARSTTQCDWLCDKCQIAFQGTKSKSIPGVKIPLLEIKHTFV